MSRSENSAPEKVSSGSYIVSVEPVEFRLTERRSKFLAYAAPATTETAAAAIINARSKLLHDASHHCWAFRVGQPGAPLERFSDAGEPSGSAGRPILVQLQHEELWNTVVVVTRWFGGVKLGVGGLMRAYGETAKSAIELIPKRVVEIRVQIVVECGYDLIGLVEQMTQRAGGRVASAEYREGAELELQIPIEFAEGFPGQLTEAAGGRVTVKVLKMKAPI